MLNLKSLKKKITHKRSKSATLKKPIIHPSIISLEDLTTEEKIQEMGETKVLLNKLLTLDPLKEFDKFKIGSVDGYNEYYLTEELIEKITNTKNILDILLKE